MHYTNQSDKVPAQGDLFSPDSQKPQTGALRLLDVAKQVAEIKSHPSFGTVVVTFRFGSNYGLKLYKRLVYKRGKWITQ